jgi:hypothetical protein
MNLWEVLFSIAARDQLLVERHVQVDPFPLQVDATDGVLLYNGVYAVLKGEFEYLRSLVPALSASKRRPAWIQAMCSCLVGIAEGSPDLFSKSLQRLLGLYRRVFTAEAIEKSICFWAHGLFELARSVSAELVALFDVESTLPWDADFQKWACGCDSPLRGVSIEKISPAIHRGIMTLSRPTWWDAHPQ